jgi:hypothetical protein
MHATMYGPALCFYVNVETKGNLLDQQCTSLRLAKTQPVRFARHARRER